MLEAEGKEHLSPLPGRKSGKELRKIQVLSVVSKKLVFFDKNIENSYIRALIFSNY